METNPDTALRFRFIWLRTFHEPYMVRGFMGDDQKIKLHLRSLDGSGGYEPGQKKDDIFVHLTETQTQTILDYLNGMDLCGRENKSMGGLDGAQWIFEQVVNDEYCVQDLFSPDEDGPNGDFRDFGLFLLQSARVKTWEIPVY